MPPGHPNAGRARYIRVKVSEETHEWWVETKRCFQMNSDDALANHLLKLCPKNRHTLCILYVRIHKKSLPFQCWSWYCHLVRHHCL